MFRRSRIFIVSTLALLMVFTTMLSNAQEPAPLPGSDDLVSSPLHQAPPDSDFSLTDAIPEEIADEVNNAVALRESLNKDQVTAIQAIIAEHQPQLQAIARNMPTPNGELTEGEVAEHITNADGVATLQQSLVDLSAVQAEIDAALMDVLDADQQVLLQTYSASLAQNVQEMTSRTEQAAAPQAEDSDCYNGAYYGTVAHYWGYYSVVAGYYDYISSGNNYSYYHYLFNYYGYNYARQGMLYASGAYCDSYYGFGSDSNNWGSNEGYTNYDASAYYSYWGSYYGYLSYYYTGSTYGYYGYYYGYYDYYFSSNAMTSLQACS